MKAEDLKKFVLLCYREMEKVFCFRGCLRRPSCTPLEYEAILNQRFQSSRSEITLLTRHFLTARYSALVVGEDAASEVFQAYEALLQSSEPKHRN